MGAFRNGAAGGVEPRAQVRGQASCLTLAPGLLSPRWQRFAGGDCLTSKFLVTVGGSVLRPESGPFSVSHSECV